MADADLARRVADAMFAKDFASQSLGIRIEEMRPGYARLRMQVQQKMLNGYHICHGGMLFTFADSAFAFACNSRDEATVAAGCSIEFLRPVQEGEMLTAIAQERSLTGRTGIYDIDVLDAEGRPVAIFRGKSARVKGGVLETLPRD
jgi:acyl-CoA thioesterase